VDPARIEAQRNIAVRRCDVPALVNPPPGCADVAAVLVFGLQRARQNDFSGQFALRRKQQTESIYA
jgi:hypothetical protein